MTILVTGAAGYIGSHAVRRLLADGHRVLAIDNLSRGHNRAIELLSAEAGGRLTFVKADVGDRATVEPALLQHGARAVMHFAALTYVGESVDRPLDYYRQNIAAGVALLESCQAAGVEKFVFSSSCATYGQPPEHLVPILETCPQHPISPYGRTKLQFEHILDDFAESQRRGGRSFGFACLRYFNVAGCDRTGLLGEDHDPETHIIPSAIQSALGLRPALSVFGTDYPTPDGTCIRDYVHVEDLVDAHVKVLEALRPGERRAYNLGIGRGYSVREIIASVKRVSGRDFTVREEPRRAGDPPRLFAQAEKIGRELGWQARITDLDEIVGSAWRWFSRHPKGYKP
ncbi:MAG: UDP-glucose 4-epimerase GalE [Phycisphaerales bacterium]|nr:UDP-glucose 4-epimerase GalE [Phycisphaerales bacterium]